MVFKMWNGAWTKRQFKDCQVAHASAAYLDKHSTIDPVMVSVVCSIPTGGNILKFLKPLDVNFGLKSKCDLRSMVKNSNNSVQNKHLSRRLSVMILSSCEFWWIFFSCKMYLCVPSASTKQQRFVSRMSHQHKRLFPGNNQIQQTHACSYSNDK